MPITTLSRSCCQTAIVLALFAGSSLARTTHYPAPTTVPTDAPTPPPTPASESLPLPPASPLTFTLSGGFSHAFNANLRSEPGRSRVSRASTLLSVGYDLRGDDANPPTPLSTGWRLNFRAGTEFSWYNFSGATLLAPAGNPGRAMSRTELSFLATHTLDSDWAYTIGAGIRSTRQSGADFSDSLTGGGYVTVRYRFSPPLALGGGALISTRLEDSAEIIPVLSLDWDLSDRLTLSSRGPGITFTATLNDQWKAAIMAGYETREFRLADSSAASPIRGGVLRDHRVPVGATIAYSPCRSFTVELGAGVILWQEYLVDNNAGVRQGSSKSRPAAYVGLQARIDF